MFGESTGIEKLVDRVLKLEAENVAEKK